MEASSFSVRLRLMFTYLGAFTAFVSKARPLPPPKGKRLEQLRQGIKRQEEEVMAEKAALEEAGEKQSRTCVRYPE